MKTYNLELHKKVNGKWVHSETVIWNVPASLAYGEMKKRAAYKAYFEFYKVTLNK